MTEASEAITLDELRGKASRVKDMAGSELRRVTGQQASKAVLVGAVAVVAAISLAYYLGTRRR